MPNGTILAIADKGLGLVLLPIEWYEAQYEVQSTKGGHILTKMSNEQCINFLKEAIQECRANLFPVERAELLDNFEKVNPKTAIGILKLVPKIHKIKEFNIHSWKYLPSRPRRGAENCPIDPYSKT